MWKKTSKIWKSNKEGRHSAEVVCLLFTGFLVVLMMLLIFHFSAQNAENSSGLSGGLSYRVVEQANRMFHLHMDRLNIENWADFLETPLRKGAHFTEYMIFAVIVCFHCLCYKSNLKRTLLAGVLFCILYAVSDEIHQYFVPGRACRMFDVAVDTAGILFGSFLFWLTVGKRKGKLNSRDRNINKNIDKVSEGEYNEM